MRCHRCVVCWLVWPAFFAITLRPMPTSPVAPRSPSPAAAAALAAWSARRTGLAFSCASLAAAAVAAVAAGVVPPDHLATAAAAALALPATTIAIAKAALGDALVLDPGLPPSVAVAPRWAGPGPRPDATRSLTVVLDSGAGRGRGVVATSPIPAGAFLGTYAGDVLDTEAFWGRYPTGVADHTMSVGRDWAIDGASIAAAADAVAAAAAATGDPPPPPPPYSPCFVNHSARRANVARVTHVAARKVDLYAGPRHRPRGGGVAGLWGHVLDGAGGERGGVKGVGRKSFRESCVGLF